MILPTLLKLALPNTRSLWSARRWLPSPRPPTLGRLGTEPLARCRAGLFPFVMLYADDVGWR